MRFSRKREAKKIIRETPPEEMPIDTVLDNLVFLPDEEENTNSEPEV